MSKNLSFKTSNAFEVSKKFKLKRNTASHYLNLLVHSKRLLKISTRPVIFIGREWFLNNGGNGELDGFQSLRDLHDFMKKNQKKDPFSEIIGHDASLYQILEQLRAAAMYPGKGLPTILTGETGSGKSYLAKKFYEYCEEKSLVSSDAPFISFNCAQYADNPELLTSSLFGYKKGAFTGAEEDHVGIFEQAQNGVLFLDEVQRLSAHGQEKLFTYLDDSVVYRVGEATHPRQLNVRLLFATTESLGSSFLKTFIRRIPVQIKVPSIYERTLSEKKELIWSFFMAESKIVNREFKIYPELIDELVKVRYKDNIGGMKSKIKKIVAMSIIHDNGDLLLKPEQSKKISFHKNQEELQIITPQTTLPDIISQKGSNDNALNRMISLITNSISAGGETMDFGELASNCYNAVNDFNDYLVFKHAQSDMPINYYSTEINRIIDFFRDDYNIKLDGNTGIVIGYYLYFKKHLNWQIKNESIPVINTINQRLIENLGLSDHVLNSFINSITENTGVVLDESDKLFILGNLLEKHVKQNNITTHGLILAHGYATASSIANVVNRLLKNNIFDAIDMPINSDTKEMAEKIEYYFRNDEHRKDTLVFIDMGSPADIVRKLEMKLGFTVGLIDNVSTLMVVDAGEKMTHGISLEQIVKKIPDHCIPSGKMLYQKNKKDLIITTCLTGIGTAKQIQKLLIESLPQSMLSNLSVKSFEYDALIDSDQSVDPVLLWLSSICRCYFLVIRKSKLIFLNRVRFFIKISLTNINVKKINKSINFFVFDSFKNKTNFVFLSKTTPINDPLLNFWKVN